MLSIELLNQIRSSEIEVIAKRFRPGARVLEIGAGTGKQALELRQRGFEVEAIDVPSSNYKGDQLFPITEYDGRNIPFPDASFDVVFSSNVLEHVRDLPGLHAEIRRVMRPGARCVHVLPTAAWRFWTMLSAFPDGLQKAALAVRTRKRGGSLLARTGRALRVTLAVLRNLFYPLVQGRHGERGIIFSELWLFRPTVWRRHFQKSGFEVVHEEPMGLHYSGYFLFGAKWSLEKRARMAKRLGSACHLFELKSVGPADAPAG
jgi:SAM-dependent methyltransferase